MRAWRSIVAFRRQHLSVSGDEEALSQVVLNLLLNAVEAAQQDGIDRPGQSRVCVEVDTTANDDAEIVISDSGQDRPSRSRRRFSSHL